MNDFNECSDEERPKISKTSKHVSYFYSVRWFHFSVQWTRFTNQVQWTLFRELRPKLRRGGIKDVWEVELMDWTESSTEQLVWRITVKGIFAILNGFLDFWFRLLLCNFLLKRYCSLPNLHRRISINLLNFLLCLEGLRIFTRNGINRFQQSFLNSSQKSNTFTSSETNTLNQNLIK